MRPFSLLFCALAAAGIAAAEDSPTPADPDAPGILLEPAFADHEMHYPIAGARKTVLVAAREVPWGVKVINRKRWEEAGLSWEKVLPPALNRAARLAEEVEIEWIRDDRDVVLYGMVESEDPWISGVLFTDGFLDRLTGKLGDTVHAVVPVRTSIFLFPRYGSHLEDYAASLEAMYEESPMKVSLEILELSESGVRATGILAQP